DIGGKSASSAGDWRMVRAEQPASPGRDTTFGYTVERMNLRGRWDAILPAWAGLAITAGVYGCLTVLLVWLLDERHILDIALLYLLVCLVSAAIWGYRVGLPSAIVADLLVNFFFVQPLHTLTVQDPSQAVALVLFLAVAAVGAGMLELLRRQVAVAAASQAETSLLLDLSKQAAEAISPQDAMNRLCTAMARAVKVKGCAILRHDATWSVVAAFGDDTLNREESHLAAESLRTGEVVRFGRAVRGRVRSQPSKYGQRSLTFVPFRRQEEGVLRFDGTVRPPALVDVDRLLLVFADEASLALHRARLAREAQRIEALQRADEFKTVLLSSVSHDLRSPLTAIKASVGSLRDHSVDWTSEDRESFLETIESQTDRLTTTVSALLEMSRLEGGVVQPSLEPIEVRSLLEEAVRAAGSSLDGHEVRVRADSALWLRADYGLILQSLVNLLSNAGKYSVSGGAIGVAAESSRGRVRMAVADAGPGIPPAELPHVFEKFYRGSGAQRAQGTGLGLSIVKSMVDLCGGSVQVQSGERGTTFSISLPAASAPPT
ncbi:MAG: ATP-binding protein, partial [Anaerolineaceae bacterium]